jgi:hypothetical protein
MQQKPPNFRYTITQSVSANEQFHQFFQKNGKADRQDGDKVEDGARRTL